MHDSGATRRQAMLESALTPITPYLDDPQVIEIMLNGDVWIERAGEGLSPTDVRFAAGGADRAIRMMAAIMDTTVTTASPSLAATLPRWRARVQACLPPVVHAPVFTIRKPATRIFTLDEYVAAGIMTAGGRDYLADAVRRVLPIIHRDPFDRMLIAQAQAEGMVLLTQDETVMQYPGIDGSGRWRVMDAARRYNIKQLRS